MDSASRGDNAASGARRDRRRSRLRPWQRVLVLCVMSVVVAGVVLGLIEGGMRIAGYGGYPRTFTEVAKLEGGSTLVFTDHGGPTSYFFANRSLPGSLDLTAFVSPKPAKVFRVLVVGESAAKGNPYPKPLSWANMLRSMIAAAAPDREIEVVNLGTTAVASFPVLGLLKEGLEYEPDLVVVYVGNNEFYGAYGVASLHSTGRSPGMIRMARWTRSLGVAQFIDAKLVRAAKGDSSKTLMETMVGRSNIGPGDPMRSAAARNLETFVKEMVDRCGSKGVPVIVCTPPANERGLAPLGDSDAGVISVDQRKKARELIDAATRVVDEDPVAAERAAREAVGIAADHATAHHVLGRALFAQKKYEESAKEFRAALDLDPMPWRPPSTSVAAVRRAAEAGGAVVCDLEKAFRDASPGGSVGWELMDDHVHASLAGQYVIARTLVRTIEGMTRLSLIPAGASASVPSMEEVSQRLGDNPYERYAAAYAMRRLAEIPFFRSTNPGFYDRMDAVCRSIESSAEPLVLSQLKAWTNPAMQSSEVRPISGMVAYALMNTGHADEAERLFRFAAESVAPYGVWELEYRYMALVCRRDSRGRIDDVDREDAGRALARGRVVLSAGPSRSGGVELYTGMLMQLRGDDAGAVPLLEAAHERMKGANRLVSDEALAQAYLKVGRREKAAGLLDAGVNAGGELATEYQRMRARIMGR